MATGMDQWWEAKIQTARSIRRLCSVSIISYSLFLGPFFAIARLAGVPGTSP
jgi:hypothetical protein